MKEIQTAPDSKVPIISFSSQREWRDWLSANYGKREGIWLRLYKKDSGTETVTHNQAIEEALCFGWIDRQGKKYDDQSWLVKFTPRRKRSI